MFLKWIAGLLVLGVLTTQAQAEEKDAPLPFDEPAAAPQAVKKMAPAAPIKVSNQTIVRSTSKVVSGKKMAAKPVAKRTAKISATKVSAKKMASRKTLKAVSTKPVSTKPAISKKKRRH